MADADNATTGKQDANKGGATDEGSTGKSDDQTGSDADLQKQLEQANAKLADAIEDRNKWKSKAREFEKAKDDEGKKKAHDSGDVEAIKASYEKEIGTFKNQVETLTSQLHNEIALGALKSAASGKAKSVNQIVGLLGGKVTVHDDNGRLIPAIKNEKGDGIEYDSGKPMSVEKFLDSFLAQEENQNLALSARKGGTGATGTNGSVNSDKIPTVQELLAMPDKGEKWLRENPKLAAKVNTSSLRIT